MFLLICYGTVLPKNLTGWGQHYPRSDQLISDLAYSPTASKVTINKGFRVSAETSHIPHVTSTVKIKN